MERKGAPLCALTSSNRLAVLASKGSLASERVDGHAAEVGGSMFETNWENWPCMITDLPNVATRNGLSSAAIGASRASLCFGDGALGAPPIVSPSYKGACQINHLSSCFSFANTKNEFSIETSCVHPDKYDVQLSEACQRRFVMFDSGSKRRMVFHPAMVKEFPTLVAPSFSPNGRYYFKSIPNGTLTVPRSNTISPLGGSLPRYVHGPMTVNPYSDLQSSASNHGPDRLSCDRNETEDKNEENLTSYSHENTEDIEALLGFDDGNDEDSEDDDEVTSTGHSPSDLTGSDNNSKSPRGSCPSKKRKKGLEKFAEDDYDDTASTAISDLGYGNEGPTSYEAAIHGKGLGMKVWGYGKESLVDCNLILPDEVSSNGSGNNHRCSNGKHQEQQHQGEKELLELSKQSRKQKIKGILRLLRGVIPGGESIDAAFFLDETIEYVRALQFKVQKLQAI